jgi:cystathionine beta-synthase
VRDFMTSRLETVSPTTPVADLLPIFERGLVAILVESGRFLGLITRIDVLNYLRRKAH